MRQRVDRARAVRDAVVDVGRASRSSPTATEPTTAQRLIFVAASVPAGVAAVAIEPASIGDSTVFALSLAAIRVVLAVGATSPRHRRPARASRGRASSPRRCSRLGLRPRAAPVRALGDRHRRRVQRDAAEDREAAPCAATATWALAPTTREALDAHHFAERFGLFLIILLGEVVVEAGQASSRPRRHDRRLDRARRRDAARRRAVVAVLRLRGRAQPQGARVSGGSPTMARAIFAAATCCPPSRCSSSPPGSACC